MVLNRSRVTARYSRGSGRKTPAGPRVRATTPGSLLRAEADPFVADGAVMLVDIVEFDREVEVGGSEPADLHRQVELRQRQVMLRGDELDAVGEQLLLGVEDIEHGARAHRRLLAYAFERDLGGLDGRLQRY